MNFLKTIAIALVACCFLGATVCGAEESKTEGVEYGLYITPKLNWSFYTGDYIDGPGVNRVRSGTNSLGGGLSLGYDFWHKFDIPVRAELEYMMRGDANFNANETNVKAKAPKTAFANFYLDYQNESTLTPYITAGAGMAFIGDRSNFAWNAGTGVRFEITNNVALDLAVRYVDFGKYELTGDYDSSINSIDTSLGIAYTF